MVPFSIGDRVVVNDRVLLLSSRHAFWNGAKGTVIERSGLAEGCVGVLWDKGPILPQKSLFRTNLLDHMGVLDLLSEIQ